MPSLDMVMRHFPLQDKGQKVGGHKPQQLAGLADDANLGSFQTAGYKDLGWTSWGKMVVDKQLLHCMKGVELPAVWHVGEGGPFPAENEWVGAAGPGWACRNCWLDMQQPEAVLKWLQ